MGLVGVSLAVVLDESSTPQAPQVLPVGAPALVPAFDAPPKARAAGRSRAPDRRPVDTTLRI
jgi:hypothetical protein